MSRIWWVVVAAALAIAAADEASDPEGLLEPVIGLITFPYFSNFSNHRMNLYRNLTSSKIRDKSGIMAAVVP
ncbi:unnamed protein product [Arctia plantaginis]|uniref:Uncharacterized protein n=1 Tax=Arctia plantaginis TaxID=874455 RepID=A0A8S0Z069_ARCPL|nr:unnamed protein product [Arctia plantaginis]